jgi:hypothetical protein
LYSCFQTIAAELLQFKGQLYHRSVGLATTKIARRHGVPTQGGQDKHHNKFVAFIRGWWDLQTCSFVFDQMSKGRRGCLTAIRAGPALLLLLALAVLCSQLAAGADVISSSKLESCIVDGSQVCSNVLPHQQGTRAKQTMHTPTTKLFAFGGKTCWASSLSTC